MRPGVFSCFFFGNELIANHGRSQGEVPPLPWLVDPRPRVFMSVHDRALSSHASSAFDVHIGLELNVSRSFRACQAVRGGLFQAAVCSLQWCHVRTGGSLRSGYLQPTSLVCRAWILILDNF